MRVADAQVSLHSAGCFRVSILILFHIRVFRLSLSNSGPTIVGADGRERGEFLFGGLLSGPLPSAAPLRPRGRLSKLEHAFLPLPWEQVRDSVEVKLLEQAGELYILAKSAGRAQKERSMRRRRLKKLLKRLHELQHQRLTRDELLLKLGAARKEARRAYALVDKWSMCICPLPMGATSSFRVTPCPSRITKSCFNNSS
jgi:hypothetical protein